MGSPTARADYKAADRPPLPPPRYPFRRRPAFAWVSEKQARTLADASRATLYRWRRDGKLPYRKVGGKLYYRLADLEAFIERHTA